MPKAAYAETGGFRAAPVMAAGVSQTLWSMDDLCEKMDAVAPKPGPRGPYKKRAEASSPQLKIY